MINIKYYEITYLILYRYMSLYFIILYNPDSQTCRDKFWAEHAINVWWQKSNKSHTESVISNDRQIAVRNLTKPVGHSVSILVSKIKQNLLMEPDDRLAAKTEQDLRCYWICKTAARKCSLISVSRM